MHTSSEPTCGLSITMYVCNLYSVHTDYIQKVHIYPCSPPLVLSLMWSWTVGRRQSKALMHRCNTSEEKKTSSRYKCGLHRANQFFRIYVFALRLRNFRIYGLFSPPKLLGFFPPSLISRTYNFSFPVIPLRMARISSAAAFAWLAPWRFEGTTFDSFAAIFSAADCWFFGSSPLTNQWLAPIRLALVRPGLSSQTTLPSRLLFRGPRRNMMTPWPSWYTIPTVLIPLNLPLTQCHSTYAEGN